MGRYQVSQRRAAMTSRVHRSSLRYQSHRDPQTAGRQRLRELAQTRVRLSAPAGIAGGAKNEIWANIGCIASITRRDSRSDGSGRGGTRPRCTGSSADRRRRAM